MTEVTAEDLYSSSYPVVSSEHQRIVHLDLKGAPPKMSYLMELLPKLKLWGATGLLVEYEDIFPYEDDLQVLQKPVESYSKSDIRELQKAASELSLDYIPLVQTIGHLEFVLKHQQFAHLREVADFCMDLCPCHPESLPLIKKILTQVLEAHSSLKFFHIGADEVTLVGRCPRCQQKMKSVSGYDGTDIYLGHVTQILTFLKETYPYLQLIMWDDILRTVDVLKMKEHNLGNLVEPMVWNYSSDVIHFENTVGKLRWDKFAQIFTHFWAASAFKGAFGSSLFNVPTCHHIKNHLLWLEEVHHKIPKTLQCRGYALTGWQRYDHFTVLCELLPAAIPSLYCCLQTLHKGAFNQEIHRDISKDLGLPSLLQLSVSPSKELKQIVISESCNLKFPGSNIFNMVILLSELMNIHQDQLAKDIDIRLQKLQELVDISRQVLSSVYEEPTVNEWVKHRLIPMIQVIEGQSSCMITTQTNE